MGVYGEDRPQESHPQPNAREDERQLPFLAEITTNLEYVAGPLNAAADRMSCLLLADEEADKVCAILPEDNPHHWDEQKLLAAQRADKQTLEAADRLVSTQQLAWDKQRGGPLWLLRQPRTPNVAARAVC